MAQEAGTQHREYIDRKKKKRFLCICSSVVSYPSLLQKCPRGRGVSLQMKFEENRSSHFRDTSGQSFGFFSSLFSFTSFYTLYKICHKMQTHTPIKLKFGTLEGLIKANLNTMFGGNPMNIHGVMTKK